MEANRARDTKPEIRVRRLLHAMGLRYLVDAPLPIDRRRRADVTFGRVSLAVFLDGCFWHGCPQHFVPPTANAGFWAAKIGTNRSRDEDTTLRMIAAGWTTLRFWEHEEPEVVAVAIRETYIRLRFNPRGGSRR